MGKNNWKDRDVIHNIVSDWEFKHKLNEREMVPKSQCSLILKSGTPRVFYQKETSGLIFKKRILNVMSTTPGIIIGKAGSTIQELEKALKPYGVQVRVKELRDYV